MWHFQNTHTLVAIQNSQFPLVASQRTLSHPCDAAISSWPAEGFGYIYTRTHTLNCCFLSCFLSCMNILLIVLMFDSTLSNFCPPLFLSIWLSSPFSPACHLMSRFPSSLSLSLCSHTHESISPHPHRSSCLSSLLLPPPHSIGLSFQISCPWMSSFRSQTPRTQLTTSCMQC